MAATISSVAATTSRSDRPNYTLSSSWPAPGPGRAGTASSIPATRTPSSRTGRDGSSARSSSRATGHSASTVLTGAGRRARTCVDLEVVGAHLDAHRAPAAPVALEVVAQLARQVRQHRLHLVQAAQVGVEGGLARLRLAHAVGLDHALVLESRQRGQVWPQAGTEPLRQPLVGQSGQLVQPRDAALLELGGGLGPDARYEQGRGGPEALRAPARPSASGSRPACPRPRPPWPPACSGRCRSSTPGPVAPGDRRP